MGPLVLFLLLVLATHTLTTTEAAKLTRVAVTRERKSIDSRTVRSPYPRRSAAGAAWGSIVNGATRGPLMQDLRCS